MIQRIDYISAVFHFFIYFSFVKSLHYYEIYVQFWFQSNRSIPEKAVSLSVFYSCVH